MKTLICIIGLILLTTITNSASAQQRKEIRKDMVKIESVNGGGKLVVTSVYSSPVQFYLFDLDGKLIYQATVKEGKQTVADLNKGMYLYNILDKDEKISSGKAIIN